MSTFVARLVLLGCAAVQVGCTIVTAQPGCGTNTTPGGAGATGSAGNTGSSGSGTALNGWTNATANLAELKSGCGNLSTMETKPDEDLVIAGVIEQGLWSSTDGGGSWQHMGEGQGSDVIMNRPASFVFDPADAQHFWESGIYGPAVYETKDDGAAFTLLGNAQHCDLVAVDFTDPARQTLLCGGHEQAKVLNLSTDGGQTWSPIGTTLPDNTNCTTPLIIDSTTFLVGCGGFGGGVSGVYRSTDSGKSWTAVSKVGVGGAGRPLRSTDGALYWASGYPGGLAKSKDDGLTWTQVASADTVLGYSPIELPDGRLASINRFSVIVSADGGVTWSPATDGLPFGDAQGLRYSAQQKAFFTWHSTCGAGSETLPPDAVMRSDFDYVAP